MLTAVRKGKAAQGAACAVLLGSILWCKVCSCTLRDVKLSCVAGITCWSNVRVMGVLLVSSWTRTTYTALPR